MTRRMLMVAAALVLVAGMATAGCTERTSSEPPPDATGGAQLAQGLHELGDGTAQAVGVLEYQDLEGGFWSVVGGTQEQGSEGSTIVVVANAASFESQVAKLAGSQVIVTGKLLDGASIRMAGPEMEATSIEPFVPTGGPAE